jgi:Icc-related predicted phosphoesterase
MKIVCTSDLHGHWRFKNWPQGDVLVVSGDFTVYGKELELRQFNDHLKTYPFKHIIVIAGNHDWCLQDKPETAKLLTNCTYLKDDSVVINGKKFVGYPWTPQFYNWAFMKPRGQMHTVWDHIPMDTDVLITHGPAAGKCDFSGGQYTGCEELRDAIARVKPKLHVSGHIHNCHGTAFNEHTIFVNGSRCNDAYIPVFDPIVVEI